MVKRYGVAYGQQTYLGHRQGRPLNFEGHGLNPDDCDGIRTIAPMEFSAALRVNLIAHIDNQDI
jgi:hypothetical protein